MTDDQWNARARNETPAQRNDRNYAEILQEMRVAQTGVQLLLAFLLTLAFTPRFGTLSAFQLQVYVLSLVLGATATALLIAPAPFHRLVFRRRLKDELVRTSSRLLLAGLVLLKLALATALLLILDVVLGLWPAVWITTGLVLWFGFWWFVLPLRYRARSAHPVPDRFPGDVGARPDAELRQHV
ncbi:heme O synthase-like polyprenyltransferase [Saccharothrix tamanrassetensis]|uniref:Heme O synthase-like polyprenyltransferase n=1 Tax=Saccharothrix tamanrassetensis TaxID=1051531 RepID=A0A841CST6_9PSEU|nr:DUF6328 family protein [Saccharothrix tamanrassetensis]MBB5960330.1 heme O synthase-like polyprenyltransferase [Saccharothrix tamanrassetensis]